jgi:hypothetical protein
VNWGDEIDDEFPVIVSLKKIPENNGDLDAMLTALTNDTPIYSDVAKLHTGAMYITRSPYAPGVIGALYNPGEEIEWGTLPIVPRTPLGDELEEHETPQMINHITSGYYELVSEVGNYILEIKRVGYVTRWAPVTVTPKRVTDLNHREIVAGDVATPIDRILTEADALELKDKIGSYFKDGGTYDPKYDLNSDGKIDQLDYNIIIKLLNFQVINYKETRLWIEASGF